MIRLWLVYVSLALAAGREIPLDDVGNAIEFQAKGTPGAVRVVGKIKEGSALKGTLKIDRMKAGGEFELRLDALETGIALRDRHMKERYLETGKWPVSKFKLEKLSLPESLKRKTGEADEIPFSGRLSLHGVEQEVTGTARAIRDRNRLMLAFQFSIRIAQFGITPPSFMGVTVGDEVRVSVQLAGKL